LDGDLFSHDVVHYGISIDIDLSTLSPLTRGQAGRDQGKPPVLTSRRSLLTGLIAFIAAAPAIVRASTLMPVHSVLFDSDIRDWFQASDPLVIDSAKQRILAAAEWNRQAAALKRMITDSEFLASDPTVRVAENTQRLRQQHDELDSRWRRGEFYRGGIHCAPEEMTPSAWPKILEKARYV
jgi:hypothetical protein